MRKSREPRSPQCGEDPGQSCGQLGEKLHKAAFGSKKFGPFLGWELLHCWREGVPHLGVFLA